MENRRVIKDSVTNESVVPFLLSLCSTIIDRGKVVGHLFSSDDVIKATQLTSSLFTLLSPPLLCLSLSLSLFFFTIIIMMMMAVVFYFHLRVVPSNP